MRFLQNQDPMIHLKWFYLFSVICSATTIQMTPLSLPGCPGKCGNLTIPFPFGLTSECCFDETFHIVCDTSFEPPKPFLLLLNLEVVSISLDGKLELLNSTLAALAKKEGYQILPMAVEWAAGKVDCHVAQEYGSRYVCQSQHSHCMVSNTVQGYICRCLPGYQGNPYTADGCQDINECVVSNPCVGVCVNLRGSFECYCPKGLVGDGRKDGTGCHTQHQTSLPAPVLVFLLAIIVIPSITVVGYRTHIGNREDRVATLRRKYFEENGGNLLRRKLSSKKLELKIYDTVEMDSIANNFRHEIVSLGCKPGEKFHRGTLPNTDVGQVRHVVVATVQRVPRSKRKHFVDQLMFLSKPHPNLVRILGCCLDKVDPVILYEHHGDGETTLSNFTRGRNPDTGFSREMRLKAVAGVARGLADFNSYRLWTPRVLHRNVCSANIMMDGLYHPKIFYAAGSNIITRDASSSQDVYRDPKFPNNWSDVYSFGVVLVELLTEGRAAIPPNTAENDRSMMVESIRTAQAKRLLEILDEEMVGEGEVVRGVAAVAERCLNVKPGKRPNMKKVAEELAYLMRRA